MKVSGKDLLIASAGLVTSLLTVFLLVVVSNRLGTEVYSWMVNGVIPAGAIISGLLAASGYFIGAKLTHSRPGAAVLIGVLVVSIAAYVAAHYFEYALMEVEGVRVADAMSFGQYWNTITSHMEMSRAGSSSESGISLGNFGYLVAFLQVVGFAIGGLIVYGILRGADYCEKCERYFHRKGTVSKNIPEEEVARAAYEGARVRLDADKPQEAVDFLKEYEGQRSLKKGTQTVGITVTECRSCGAHRLKLSSQTWNGKEYDAEKTLNDQFDSQREVVL